MQKKVFREYTSIHHQENHWGIQVKNAGYTQVLPDDDYPGEEHPTEYYFSWARGRVLQEYQLILITRGRGEFESASGKKWPVKPGTVMLLFKNEWHRYRPDIATGWQEYWLGFDGPQVEFIFQNSLFQVTQPVLYVGDNDMLTELMLKVFALLETREPGNEKIVAAYVPVILASLETHMRRKPVNNKAEKMVKSCQREILEQFDQSLDLKQMAADLQVSYTYLRRMFRQFTGTSPHQYLLKLRLQKARDLLVMSNKSVKEIALECGFNSPYYFSRYFKEDRGMAPSEYRAMVRGEGSL